MPLMILLGIVLLHLAMEACWATVVLRAGTIAELEPLSPVVTEGFWYGTGYTGFLHMPLITYRAPDASFGPCLAEAWEVSEDNRSITFRLHRGARWHDGRPLTAADVAFTMEYLKEKELIGQLWRFLEKAEALDEVTARISFTESVAYYQSMFFPWPKILPQHIWESVEEPGVFQGDLAMVGSGPFALSQYDADARIATLRKVEDFFDGDTAIDELRIRFFGSTDALLLALKRGEIDVVMGPSNHVPLSHLPSLIGAEGVGLSIVEDSGVPLTMVFNYNTHPASIPAFRRAMSHAVDSATLIEAIVRGRGRKPELGFVPPALWTYGGPTTHLRHDPKRAAALLDSLGFADVDGDGVREDVDGSPFTLEIIPETWQDAGNAIRAVELIVYQLGQVGVRAKLTKYVEEQEYQLLWVDRSYTVYVGHATHASTRDGGHVYFANYRDFSYGTFEDSSYFAILDRITHAADEAAYLEAVRESQLYNAAHLPGLALIWGEKVYVFRTDKFTGWRDMVGYGIPNYDSWFSLQPVKEIAATEVPSSGRFWVLPVALVAAALAMAVWRRRRYS